MRLYSVTIGNSGDDTTYDKVILSFEPLDKDNVNLPSICGLNGEDIFFNEFILSVTPTNIILNPWDENEADKMVQLLNMLNK